MKQWLQILSVAIMLVCGAGCTQRPHNVLSQKRMSEVLYDLHRADGILQTAGYNYGHDEELAGYYSGVLQKHGLTQAQFDSSIVWYTAHPKQFARVYPKVVARLEQDVESIRVPEQIQGRSLAEIKEEESGGHSYGRRQERMSLDSLILQVREGISFPKERGLPPIALQPDSMWIYSGL